MASPAPYLSIEEIAKLPNDKERVVAYWRRAIGQFDEGLEAARTLMVAAPGQSPRRMWSDIYLDNTRAGLVANLRRAENGDHSFQEPA